MKELKLTKGYVAIVDDEDFEIVSQWHWSATKCCDKVYARRTQRYGNKKVQVYLHRYLMNIHLCDKTVFCDHKDRDTMNNQKSNLRVCTAAENQRNKTKKRNGMHKYMGVSANHKRFSASLSLNGKRVYIGTYDTQEEAAIAYNKKKIEVHGDFVNLNVL
jgi:hypothetical protein